MAVIENPAQYLNNNVTIVYTDGSTQRVMDGLVTKTNPTAMLVKVRGKGVQLLDVNEIESITVVAPPRPVARVRKRVLDTVIRETVTQHLADRHGWTISKIPEDLEIALLAHDGINHSDLSHRHPKAGETPIEEVLARLERVEGDDDDEDYDDEADEDGLAKEVL
jgi:hypothetical protein